MVGGPSAGRPDTNQEESPHMSRKLGLIALLLVLVLVAAACGGDAAGTTTTAVGSTTTSGGATTTAAALSGSVDISGSSTVEPISARVAEKFSALYPDVALKVEGPGTGDGAQLFCTGQIDIGDASRHYKQAELDLCAQNGIEFIELQVAIDGITVMTNPENQAVSCLADADLYALMGPESTGFDNWADANDLAAETGAPNAPYPDARLAITAPGEESGTYDTFNEFAIAAIAKDRGTDAVMRPDYVASPNDNVIIEGIEGSPTSLGFVGFSYYLANQDRVKAIGIGDGCVIPTHETIADGSYPFARPLFIYVNLEAAMRPEVAAFVDLYLSEQGLASIDDTGYIRLPDYGPTLDAWQNR
jgi:phosphate transport system substrate-binding protein